MSRRTATLLLLCGFALGAMAAPGMMLLCR